MFNNSWDFHYRKIMNMQTKKSNNILQTFVYQLREPKTSLLKKTDSISKKSLSSTFDIDLLFHLFSVKHYNRSVLVLCACPILKSDRDRSRNWISSINTSSATLGNTRFQPAPIGSCDPIMTQGGCWTPSFSTFSKTEFDIIMCSKDNEKTLFSTCPKWR